MSFLHSKQTVANGIHIPISYEFADAAARNAVGSYLASDVGKFARQLDTNALYWLSAVATPGASATPTWSPLGGSSRKTVTVNIDSLANNATANILVPLAKGFTIYRTDTSIPYRVRLYSTAAYRTADAARQPGTAPTGDHGVILDTLTTAEKLYDSAAPYPTGVNLEAVPSANIPAAITNKSGSTQAGTVTFIYLPEEN